MDDTQKTLREFQNSLGKSGAYQGELRLDPTTRYLYSTDASIYQIEPLGVAFPKIAQDLEILMETAALYNLPVLARGSGSGLAGQAIGAALILDCSKYLNKILELDPDRRIAVVEPGVILSHLNRKVASFGLQFGPDPASAERACIGGCIANNATGAHSIVYGMTSDHLISTEVVLGDGERATLEAVTLERARQLANGSSSLSRFYASALSIRQNYADEIQAHWPQTWRRVSGYNLNYLLPWSPTQPPLWEKQNPEWIGDEKRVLAYPPVESGHLNLAHLICGSEGTLAVIQRAMLRLVPKPKFTVLVLKAYASIAEACDDVPEMLRYEPSAVELIPNHLISLARSVPAYAGLTAFMDNLADSGNKVKSPIPAAMLVLEFSGDLPEETMHMARRVSGKTWIANSPVVQQNIWAVRKVGLGILMSAVGNHKPVAFIEDMAVPPEQLGGFVREVERILAEHHTQAEFYAHASAGCLHIRPVLNLKSHQGVLDLRTIAAQVVTLALKLGGAISAEHGDGLARSEWIELAYGPRIVEAFRHLKKSVDPKGLLNPGKIIDPLRMDENLRYGTAYHAEGWQPFLTFSPDHGRPTAQGLLHAIEQCNGAGVCRKAEGVMCPSFQASQDEMHSTRGRSNLLRAMVSGELESLRVAEQLVREALDLCLACKGCKAECPSGVDVAKLKYEFTHHYYQNNAQHRPVRDYLFGFIGPLAELGQPFGLVVNTLTRQAWFRGVGERLLGLSAKRTFPQFSKTSFFAWLKKNGYRSQLSRLSIGDSHRREQVLMLMDAFHAYFYPESGIAAYQLLAAAGCDIQVIPVLGAGRTLISKGFLDAARKHASRVLLSIRQLDIHERIPVVGVEPSEIYSLRDEYLDLLPGEPGVTALAQRAWMVEEFLLRPGDDSVVRIERIPPAQQLASEQMKILLHGHCYQKAQPPAADGYPIGVKASVELLKRAGYSVEVIEDGCCGMAGAFGYEKEHYDFSLKVGELALFPAIRKEQARFGEKLQISTPGVSCQAQIKDGVGVVAKHPVVLAAERLLNGSLSAAEN